MAEDNTKYNFKAISKKLKISDKLLEKWSQYFEIKEYKMGQSIISPDCFSSHIYIIIDGEVRLRGFSLNKKSAYTIGLVDSGAVLGLASKRVNKPIEMATASRKTNLLCIPNELWKDFFLEVKNDSYSQFDVRDIDQSELWYLITRKFINAILPKEAKDLKIFLKEEIINYKCLSTFELRNISEIDLKGFNWILIESNNSGLNKIKAISSEDLKSFEINNDIHRLIYWPKGNVKENISDRSDESDVPKNIISEFKKESTENVNNEKELKIDDSFNEETKHKFYSSDNGIINETNACFRMLGSFLNLPVRKESIQKILEDQFKKSQDIGLDLCAAIGESLGLKSQLAKIPKNLIGRVTAPIFFKDSSNKIYICFEIKKDSLIIANPTESIKEFSFDKFHELLGKEEIDILLFTKTSRSPSQNFGLNWFKPSLKKHKKALIEVLVASVFVQLFQLMNPLIIQQIIDKVIGQNGINTLPVLATLLISFSIFENVLTAVRTNLFIDTTNRIDLSLGEEIIDHLLRLPLSYFDKRPVGELSSRLGEMEQIRSFLTGTALTVLLDSLFSVIYIAIMLVYSWILTIVSLLVAPILASITFLISPVLREQLRKKAELNAKTQNHLVEILTGIQTVKAQNIELNSRWKWRQKYTKYISEGYKNAITSTTTNSLTAFLNQVSSLSVLCVGTYLVTQGQLSLGELIAFRIICGYVTTPLLRLANLYQGFQQTAISIERIGDILNNVQESTPADKFNIPLKPVEGEVNFEDLSFRFNPKGALNLSQVNINVKPGEFVAIVGQSGSGKSTLMKLLARLYEPESGKISIDKFDISKVELYSLRRQIGVVPQESLLFDGSIQDNISLSNKEATSDEVIEAARVACAHDFIMDLSMGYASSVGERGSSLSGGQRQRIAIARTVLQNPKLLIMDEATSALDYETERKVSLNLMEYFRSKTVFFITHRLSSITHADRIIMMHQGKLEEEGTHEELISKKGRYYALYNQQKFEKN